VVVAGAVDGYHRCTVHPLEPPPTDREVPAVLRSACIVLLLLVLSGCTGSKAEGDRPSARPTDSARLGACRLLTTEDVDGTSNDSPAVDCATRHTAQTFAVGTFPDEVADRGRTDPALGRYVYDRCRRRFTGFLGGNETLVLRSLLSWAWFRADEAVWDHGIHTWRCDVVAGGHGGTDLLALPATAKGLLLGRPDDRWMVCVDGPTVAGSVKSPCSEPHVWRAVTTIVLGEKPDPYPGDRLTEVRTRDFCSDSVGAWLNYPVDYEYGYTAFHAAEWKAGNRRSICWAKTDQ
jgi:hypothetical protein